MGRIYGHDVIETKFYNSIPRLAKLALRYSFRALKRGDFSLGLQYWHLAQAFYPEIRATRECLILGSFFNSEVDISIEDLEVINLSMDFQRKVSYSPDEPYAKIDKIFL
jgi:hypothetical protein